MRTPAVVECRAGEAAAAQFEAHLIEDEASTPGESATFGFASFLRFLAKAVRAHRREREE